MVSVAGSSWEPINSCVSYTQSELELEDRKYYKLSFELQVKAGVEYDVAMLPLYTYSQMLEHLNRVEETGQAKVEVLTQSIAGMAIPLITFEKPSDEPKNIVLISGRVHPGETVASYIMHGLIERLVGLAAANS